jgi:hypothetical protein
MSLNETRFKLTSSKRFIALQYSTYLKEQNSNTLKSLLEDLEILCRDSTTGTNIRHITDNLRNIIVYKDNLAEQNRYMELSINAVLFSINKSENQYELYQLLYLINPFIAEQFGFTSAI